MSAINFHTKEISVKIVYYGPGLCGKTTSLQTIYASLPPEKRPQIVSLATEVDRTIFFDFLPITAYRIRDFKVRLQLYTVPGQVFYNATRKLVLNGVDGLVFVADSQVAMRDSNLESLQNLEENLAELGMEVRDVPLVMQFNKRDLTGIETVEEMDRLYNPHRVPVFATVATTGSGLFDSLRAISQLVVNNLIRKGLGRELRGGEEDTRRALAQAEAAKNVSGPLSPSTPAGSVSESITRATQAASQSAAPPAHSVLWPTGEYATYGVRIEGTMAAGRWADAVLAVEAFIRFSAAQWAHANRSVSADPIPSFLLVRGVSAERYRNFFLAVQAAHSGMHVTRDSAMSAMVIALQAVW